MKGRRYSTAWLAAAGLALGAGSGGPALAGVVDEERVYRQEALAHAGAVASAYRRLEEHILLGSTGITAWTGSVPPASTGWLALWTERGVRARYCDDTLLVYLAPSELKGVGADHRSVHVAPFAYVPDGNEGQFPALHWLEGNVAQGGAARPTLSLPGCMTGDPLPSGRAALAGGVKDPFVHMTDGVSHELKTEACPAGMHGPGRRYAREIRQRQTGRGDPVGAPVEGTWRLVADACRGDYDDWEHYTVACSWTAGAPHHREMFGEEIWRRLKSVTAAGMTYGTPEFVSTSCWSGVAGTHPTPVINETSSLETMSVACGQGHTGTRRYRRTKTTRSTQFPWDDAPVITVRTTSWSLASSTCAGVQETTPPACDPDVEECEGTLECDPLTDEDCGQEGGTPPDEPDVYEFDVDKTRTRLCSVANAALTGTYVETQTCRYQYELYADGTRSDPVLLGCGVWWMSEDNCVPPPPPPGSTAGGYPPGSPGSGQCAPPSDGSASPGDGECGGLDPGIAAAIGAASGDGGSGDGGGGDGGGGGGCYFTTAVVEQRGEEPDDGPTLTALRDFRDTYMMETPLRRAMVWAYYRIAPLVVRDLPADDPSWQPMGEHIDRSVALIREGRLEAAFRAYVTGSSRLMLRWWLLRAGKAFS